MKIIDILIYLYICIIIKFDLKNIKISIYNSKFYRYKNYEKYEYYY